MQQKCLDFIQPFADSIPDGVEVLDVGSLDVNGTFKPLFSRQKYTGSDVVAGPNVDAVQPSHDVLPFEDGRFDVVISGNMLEHCENPFAISSEMVRVLKTGGKLMILAPWKMDWHGSTQYYDNWRFSPTGLEHLVKGLKVGVSKCDWADIYYPYEVGSYMECIKL